jgi:quercetin dioxygenase-like cupin family protein
MTAQTVVNASDEAITAGPISIHFLLTGEDTNGSVSVFEMTIPAGAKVPAPPHLNDAYEETLYGLEGVLTWTIDGQPVEVGPGHSICIRRGTVHRFENRGAEDAKQLCIVTPAIMSPAYFHDAILVLRESAGGPPDPAKMAEVFRRHGMTIARSS